MRKRAFRPEVVGCLEVRSLLSGVAGASADPVPISRHRLNFVAESILSDFYTFARNDDIINLHNDLSDVIVIIPFWQRDGLGRSINRIVHRLRHDIRTHVPLAGITARNDALAVTRAVMVANVRAGRVVVP
jgi:hypothetical protein